MGLLWGGGVPWPGLPSQRHYGSGGTPEVTLRPDISHILDIKPAESPNPDTLDLTWSFGVCTLPLKCLHVVFPGLRVFILPFCCCWLMCWTFRLIFSCKQFTIVPVFIKNFLDCCLHWICKIFTPFLSVLFYCKYIICIHSQAVTLFHVYLLLVLPQDLPYILPCNILMVHWFIVPEWYMYLIGKIPYVIFIGSIGVTQMKNLGMLALIY